MMKRRICIVVTARPSYSRIKTTLDALRGRDADGVELQVVVAASALLDRYGRVVDTLKNDGFTVAAEIYSILEGESPIAMAKTAGLGLLELATVLSNLKSDLVVTVADRFETISTAVAAAYQNIPVAHIQGGEVTGSIDEKVRHAVTKLADLHCVATPNAAERVIRMGEHADTVYVTGCPSIDIAAQIQMNHEMNFDPFIKYGGVGDLKELHDGYLVVLQHPVTTEYKNARQHVVETLNALQSTGIPVLWFWPNVDAGADGTSKGLRSFREKNSCPHIRFFKNMLPDDFLRLLYNSKCIVGNSSVAIRECSYLGVPAVNIGTRQQGRERGANVIDVGYDAAEIRSAVLRQVAHGHYESDHLYGDGNAGLRIAEILATAPLSTEKRLTY
jgi:UDP-hydrolysing UDP-N-acetyl-D-glucosamine 2-epimerase